MFNIIISVSFCIFARERVFLVPIGPIKCVLLNFNVYSHCQGQSNCNWVVVPRNIPVEDLISSQFQIIARKKLPQALTSLPFGTANCILRNRCEIAKSPYYQNFQCSVDFAKSFQFAIGISPVQLILRN